MLFRSTYMHTKGIIEANNMYALPRKDVEHWIPSALLDFKDLVDEIFTSERPMDLISANHKLLNNLSGMKMDNKKLNVIESSNLFSLE